MRGVKAEGGWAVVSTEEVESIRRAMSPVYRRPIVG